jgi:hypothetical protein
MDQMDMEVSGQRYRFRKMSVKEQGRVARKLLPFIKVILPFIRMDASAEIIGTNNLGLDDITRMVEPLGQIISDMPDKDWDALVLTCMATITRLSGDRYAPIWNIQGDIPMFTDIELPQQLWLMGGALKFNLGPFMAVLPTLSNPGVQTATL